MKLRHVPSSSGRANLTLTITNFWFSWAPYSIPLELTISKTKTTNVLVRNCELTTWKMHTLTTNFLISMGQNLLEKKKSSRLRERREIWRQRHRLRKFHNRMSRNWGVFGMLRKPRDICFSFHRNELGLWFRPNITRRTQMAAYTMSYHMFPGGGELFSLLLTRCLV